MAKSKSSARATARPAVKRQSLDDRNKNKKSRTRVAPKQKPIEVDGHQLIEAMHSAYLASIETRKRAGCSVERSRELALDDVLEAYRPSVRISAHIRLAYSTITSIANACITMFDYPYFSGGSGTTRTAGCNLLKQLAQDLVNAATRLTAIAENVQTEEDTKLQDWIVQEKHLERICVSHTAAWVNHERRHVVQP